VSLVRDATLAGNRLAFTVITELGSKIVTMKFAGQVIGDRIAGTVDIDEAGQTRQQEWTATRRRP
jgi:hypothetical protein